MTRGETHGRTGDVRVAGVTGTSGERGRGDRTAIGTAVPRTAPPPHGGGGGGYPIYIPGYFPGYFYPYAFGIVWDPFWWGSYSDPMGSYYPAYGGGVDTTSSGDTTSSSDESYGYGSLKLKVKPNDAQVYVDGYFSGLVDDYDGMFQKLNLEVGVHHIEIRAEGYQTLAFDIRIELDQTVTYKGELQKLQGQED